MVYDGARYVADQSLRFTQFGQFWNDIHQSSQQAFHAWVDRVAPWLWTSVIRVLLEQPVFAVLGLGLALPFLLIGFIPALRNRLPRPGPWMEQFRRMMAIPIVEFTLDDIVRSGICAEWVRAFEETNL